MSGYKCEKCLDMGFYIIRDENNIEMAVTCECHPAVRAHRVRNNANKYSWKSLNQKMIPEGYAVRG